MENTEEKVSWIVKRMGKYGGGGGKGGGGGGGKLL
jgi:hypothetical protein